MRLTLGRRTLSTMSSQAQGGRKPKLVSAAELKSGLSPEALEVFMKAQNPAQLLDGLKPIITPWSGVFGVKLMRLWAQENPAQVQHLKKIGEWRDLPKRQGKKARDKERKAVSSSNSQMPASVVQPEDEEYEDEEENSEQTGTGGEGTDTGFTVVTHRKRDRTAVAPGGTPTPEPVKRSTPSFVARTGTDPFGPKLDRFSGGFRGRGRGQASTPAGRYGLATTRGGGAKGGGASAGPVGQMVGQFRFPPPPLASVANPAGPTGSRQASEQIAPSAQVEKNIENEQNQMEVQGADDAAEQHQPSPKQLAQDHTGIKMWVRPENKPFPDDKKDAESIQGLVTGALMKVPEREPSPGFNGTAFIRGSVIFNCVNHYTAEWLTRYLAGVHATENGVDIALKVTEHEYRADLVRVNAWFPKEHPDPQQCIEYLGYLNRDSVKLESKRWRLLQRVWVDNGSRYRVMLLIPTKDWEQIVNKLGQKPTLRCGLFMIPMWVPVRKLQGPRVPPLGDQTEFPAPSAESAKKRNP